MKKITFYIYDGKEASGLAAFADIIAGVMPRSSVYIHTDNEKHSLLVYEALWQYPSDRFLPSSLDEDCPDCVMYIGHQQIPNREFIINVSAKMIETPDIEWVSNNKSLARERYQCWKKKGHQLDVVQA